MKKLLLCMSAMLFLFAGCNAETVSTTDDAVSTAPGNASADADADSVSDADANANSDSESSVSVSDGNTIIITLYPETAPITCENFETLVSDGFYNGLTFHRVVDDFMAQGGDPSGDGTGGSSNTIKGEFSSNGVENNLSHKRGVVSMARSAMNDSASSQFFICYADCSFLDGNYAAFGEVTEGMEVVDSFLDVPRSYNAGGELAVPDSPITMEEVTMIDPDENGNPRVKIVMNTIPVAE